MLVPLIKIAKILGKTIDHSLLVNAYAIDSRKVTTGALFFALKGERVDGHDFLHEVARNGAYAAVVNKDYKGPGYGLTLFFVDDVIESLQLLAKTLLKERGMRVIAVTGSVGKTTTKEMIYHLLSMKHKVHATKGNQNTKLTLPITILEAKGDEEFLLLEMGMTKKGQIKKLVSIAPPEVVVLTEITYVHSENFNTLEDIAEAKAEVFTVDTKFSVIHINSAKFNAVYRNCFSHNTLYPSVIPVISPYKESHFTENFAAAYAVAKYVGMDDNQIRLASLSLLTKRLNHRFEKIERDGILFIDDSYNASVPSVTSALKNLPDPEAGGRKIFVFGEMKELGEMAASSHQIVANVAAREVDIVICLGRETKAIVDRFKKDGKEGHYHFDYRSLKAHLFKLVKKGDVVLIKGANSHKLWHLLDKVEAMSE